LCRTAVACPITPGTTTLQVGLEDGGLDVDTFDDPSLALKSFRPNFYDLVLIDIGNIDGLNYMNG
jgi:DNA-binding response OmpR family regulator